MPSAAYVSLNLELTGIQIPTVPRPSKFDQPFERYKQLKHSPERYSIVQVGICLFHENPEFKKYAKRVASENNNDEDGDVNNEEDDNHDDGGAQEREIESNHQDLDEQEIRNILLNAMPVDVDNGRNDQASDDGEFQDNQSSDDESYVLSEHSSLSSILNADGESNSNDDGSVHSNENVNNNNDNNNNDDNDNQGEHLGQVRILRRRQNRGRDNTEPPEFFIRQYDFLIFPSEDSSREVVLNPKSIHFINKNSNLSFSGPNDFNWEDWIQHGIPYTTVDAAEKELQKFQEEFANKSPSKTVMGETQGASVTNGENVVEGSPSSIPPNTTEESDPQLEQSDIAFIARSMAGLREWIDSAATPRRNFANNNDDDESQDFDRPLRDNLTLLQEQRLGIVRIVPQSKKAHVNRHLKKKIQWEYPALHWDTNDQHEVLVRLNDEEKKIRDERRKKFAWRKIQEEKIGFTRVFQALSLACNGILGNIGDIDAEYQNFLETTRRNQTGSTICTGVVNETNEGVLNLGVQESENGDEGAERLDSISTDGEKERQQYLNKISKVKKRRVPLVVHNGFLDILFLLTHFQNNKLPSAYEDAKEMTRALFPLIYDTKVLATEFSDYAIRSKHTSLSNLHQRFVRGDGLPDANGFLELHLDHIPRSRVVNRQTSLNSSRVTNNSTVMIGTVFQCLCRRIKNESTEFSELSRESKKRTLFKEIVTAGRSKVGSLLFLDEKQPQSKSSAPTFGLNKVFLSSSIFTVDMEAIHDHLKPGYATSAIFKVSHPNKTVPLNEINSVIRGIKDPLLAGRQPQKLHYEIGLTSKWFIVAARSKYSRDPIGHDPNIRGDVASTLSRRGKLLEKALHDNFSDCQIESLSSSMLSPKGTWSNSNASKSKTSKDSSSKKRKMHNKEDDPEESRNFLSSIFGFFDFNKNGMNKRRRTTE